MLWGRTNPLCAPWGLGGMGENSRGPSLPRRVPGASNAPEPRRRPARPARPSPPASLQAPVTDTAGQPPPGPVPATRPARSGLPQRVPGASNVPRPPQTPRPVLPASVLRKMQARPATAPPAPPRTAAPMLPTPPAGSPTGAVPPPAPVRRSADEDAAPPAPPPASSTAAGTAAPPQAALPARTAPVAPACPRRDRAAGPSEASLASAAAQPSRERWRRGGREMWSAAVKWRMLGLVGSVLLLLTAGGVIAALSRHPGTAGGAGSPGSQGAGAIGAEAQTQDLAATWVAHEVIRDAIVSCDPLMCQILQAHGVPAGDLLVLRLGTADPLGSELVVATAAIRSQFGSSLTAVYAPAVIAKFGSGNAAIAIRAIAPDGARAYDTALAADIAARKAAGAQLLHNGRITVAAPAAGYLAAGQADSRLIVTLATLAALNPVDVAAFGD